MGGAFDLYPREIQGRRVPYYSSALAAALERRLDAFAQLATDSGGRLLLLTTPCFDPSDVFEAQMRTRLTETQRITWFNERLRE